MIKTNIGELFLNGCKLKKMVNPYEALPEHPGNGVFPFTSPPTRLVLIPLNRSWKVLYVKKIRIRGDVEIENLI